MRPTVCVPSRFLAQSLMPPSRVGFVTFESACYFRAGKAKSAEQVISAKIRCDACSLYVILRAGEHGLGHAFSPPPPSPPPPSPPPPPAPRPTPSLHSSGFGTKSIGEGWYRIARHNASVLVPVALAALFACVCVTWALCISRCIWGASRDWQRLPDDPSPRSRAKSWGKDVGNVDPESNPVPVGSVDKARFHVDRPPTAMDEQTLMARLAGDWMPWFLLCTPTSRPSSVSTRPGSSTSTSTSPRPSTSHTEDTIDLAALTPPPSVIQVRVLPPEGSYAAV